MKTYNELKKKHPDALLLFRVGDFYECYYDDAVQVSSTLGLTLTKKGCNMCGFPHHALDTYLPKLIRAGFRVAICDKMEDPVNNKVKQLKKERMEVKKISLGNIEPSPMNPRKTFDEEALKELASNIEQQGLLQPITVRPTSTDKYEIVCGERRYRAFKLSGIDTEIPCIVKEMDDEQAFDAMITENLQRKDVDPIEEAFAFSQLAAKGKTTEEIALRFGKNQRFVADRIKLESLIPDLKKKVTSGEMAIGAAIIISKLTEDEQQEFFERFEDDDQIIKSDAVDFTDRLFRTISRAKWESYFQGSCKSTCAECPFNTANVGNLFYSMKEHDARCTCKEKFEAKSTDWLLNRVNQNAYLLAKAGEPIEVGKGIILYDTPQSWMGYAKEYNELVEKVRGLGFEMRENDGSLFDRYSSYHEGDERLQALIDKNEVCRCVCIDPSYGEFNIGVRYYKYKKEPTGEQKAEAEAMNLVRERKDVLSRMSSNASKALRISLRNIPMEDIPATALTGLEQTMLLALLMRDTSFEFRNSKQGKSNGTQFNIYEHCKAHPEEASVIAREYLRAKLSDSAVEWTLYLQQMQQDLCKNWLPQEHEKELNGRKEKAEKKIAEIDAKLAELGYDSEGHAITPNK